MLDEAKMRRLAMAQYLYTQGVEQSHKPEPLNSTCLLPFHDAMEHFLALASEHLNAGKAGVEFTAYWSAIDQKLHPQSLGQKDSMGRMNKARVSWKHYGISVPTAELEGFRGNIMDFLRENTPKVFGIDFEAISMASLTQDSQVRDYLLQSEQYNAKGDIKSALKEVTMAFYYLLGNFKGKTYENNGSYLTLFSPRFFSPIEREAPKDLKRFAQKIEEELKTLHDHIHFLALGIDHRRYSRFLALTPRISHTMANTHDIIGEGRGQTHHDYYYCYNFVIECALRIQEIQFF